MEQEAPLVIIISYCRSCSPLGREEAAKEADHLAHLWLLDTLDRLKDREEHDEDLWYL